MEPLRADAEMQKNVTRQLAHGLLPSTSSAEPYLLPSTAPKSLAPSSLKDAESAQPGFLTDADIKVIGVGGGGSNAVQHMIDKGVSGVQFICANTDAQALKRSSAGTLLQLGKSGLGAGARPEVGLALANEAQDAIRKSLEGAQMVFITAGLGGGTGTGAAPVIAKMAREMGILTVGVVTKPFDFEGSRRMRAAEEGLRQLEENVDSLIVVLNDRLMEVLGEDVSQEDAFCAANDVLRNAVGGISNIIHVPGFINVDFEDVKTIMEQPGRSMMGTAVCAGPDRSTKAAELAIACPLLEGIDLSGANGVLVLIAASKITYLMSETKNVMNTVRRYAHADAHIIMGAVYEEALGDQMRVTVIATGLASPRQNVPRLVPATSQNNQQLRPSAPDYRMENSGADRTRFTNNTTANSGAHDASESLDVHHGEIGVMLHRQQINDAEFSGMGGAVVHEDNFNAFDQNIEVIHLRGGNPNSAQQPAIVKTQTHQTHQLQPRTQVQDGYSGARSQAGSVGGPSLRSPLNPAKFPARVPGSPVMPAVWHNNRTMASSKVSGLMASGMSESDVPAFLRKQAD